MNTPISHLLPFLVPLIGAVVVLIVDGALRREEYSLLGSIAVVTSVLTGVAFLLLWQAGATTVYFLARVDGLTVFSACLISFCTAVAALLSHEYLRRENIPPGPYYSLLLIASQGLIFLAASVDWVCFFIALEIASVPLYVLSGIERRQPASREAALKFFLLGAVASAFTLYGIAFVYGATGTTAMLPTGPLPEGFSVYLLIGAPLVLAGLCFKLGVAPMHFWAPDTFDGAPTPLVSFIATGSKVGVFAALVRIVYAFTMEPLAGAAPKVLTLLSIIALVSMIWGNLAAVVQTRIKRLLAYSSIAHGGYMLLGYVVLAGAANNGLAGPRAAMLYLAAYCFMTLCAFAVLVALGRQGDGDLSQYTGLYFRQPTLALILTAALLSMTGIPLTVGFLGKYAVFVGAAGEHFTLVVVALLTSVVAAYYYLKVLVLMYMKQEMGLVLVPQSYGYRISLALAATAVCVIGFGLVPGALMRWIEAAFSTPVI